MNTTTPWIDQNQTYTSHPSHQVFLREYVRVDPTPNDGIANPLTFATGRLLNGGADGKAIANWAEVKAQAKAMLGIELVDTDIHNVPVLKTDPYGKFIPGPNGYAQMLMQPDATHATTWFKEGTAEGIRTTGAVMTGHAFLDDIANTADPVVRGRPVAADADTDIGNAIPVGPDGTRATYDNELLDRHFITGDGRGNENIGLTAVHTIFHSEHNRLVEANKATILASGDLAFINEWLRVDVTSLPTTPEQVADLQWDGERLFQAAKFVTEMQYQHLVFEEFAGRCSRTSTRSSSPTAPISIRPSPPNSRTSSTGSGTRCSAIPSTASASTCSRWMPTERAGQPRTRPDRGVPEPARLHRQRHRHRRRRRRHHPWHDTPDRQRDRRVRGRLPAQQTARAPPRPRRPQHGAGA